jgi:hypothetical protein
MVSSKSRMTESGGEEARDRDGFEGFHLLGLVDWGFWW